MKIKLAFLLTLVSVAIHTYLSFHFYEINYGVPSGDSLCNLGSTFNCDAVAVSRYSRFLGTPIALWGAAFNGLLAVFLLGLILNWTENFKKLLDISYLLSGFIALTSVVMATLSVLALSTYCLFCIGAYFTSFATLFLVGSIRGWSLDVIPSWLSSFKEKSYLVLYGLVPAIVFFSHLNALRQPQSASLKNEIQNFIALWQRAPIKTFSEIPFLTLGSKEVNPKMTIVEFADFRCFHCKNAAPVLKSFVRSRPNTQLHFYVFPLSTVPESDPDLNCISCTLAKAVICSSAETEKGWAMHDKIFAHQEEIIGYRDNSGQVTALVTRLAKELTLSEETFLNCLKSDDSQKKVKAASLMGKEAGVEGTPAVFVNGKLLRGGQVFPVLDALHKVILAN